MGRPIDMELKGYGLIWFWTHYMTLHFISFPPMTFALDFQGQIRYKKHLIAANPFFMYV